MDSTETESKIEIAKDELLAYVNLTQVESYEGREPQLEKHPHKIWPEVML